MKSKGHFDGGSQSHGSTITEKSKSKVLFKLFHEVQAENFKRMARAEAYRVKKRQDDEKLKDQWIRAFKQLKRELRSYEQAVRRRLPTLKSMLTPEKIAEARVKYLAQLAQAPVAAPVEAAVEEAAAVTCRSGTVRLAVEEPLFDAETGEELSTITSTSLFDEDVLRALQPPPPATERSADSSKQEKQRMVLGGTMRLKGTMRSRGGGAGLLTATQRLSPMQEPSTADGQSLAEDSRALPSVIWALPRDSSSDEEEGSEGDEEDAEFLEHRWLVALQAMAVSQPQLHQQIQDIRRCREVHKQELLELLEAESQREQERQAEERRAIGAQHRYRLMVRHERERKERRLGIERVRYDYEYILGQKLVACNIIR